MCSKHREASQNKNYHFPHPPKKEFIQHKDSKLNPGKFKKQEIGNKCPLDFSTYTSIHILTPPLNICDLKQQTDFSKTPLSH